LTTTDNHRQQLLTITARVQKARYLYIPYESFCNWRLHISIYKSNPFRAPSIDSPKSCDIHPK